jgi:integrase
MRREGLTAKQVQHAKPDPTRRIEVPAGPPSGLYLVLHPSGRKGWCLRYRWRDRTRNLTFHTAYPEMTLAMARAEAEAKLTNLEKDIDPAAEQAEEIQKATPDSVKSVIEEWIRRYVQAKSRKDKYNLSERSRDEFERIIRKEVLSVWKDKLITEVTRPDILRLLDSLMDRETPMLANKTLAVLKIFLNWATDERGYLSVSPAARIKPPAELVSRERVLDPSELSTIWNAIEPLGYPVTPFMKILFLTAQRRGEIAQMRWRDIDMDQGLWTVPAEMMKSGRTHLVPLSEAVLELLKTLPRFKHDYVFSTTSGLKAISGFSKMKQRIDRAIREASKKAIPSWCFHDARRTATTMMAPNVEPHILSAILGHSAAVTVSTMPSAAITKVYNRYAYLDEKREALEAWSQYVLKLTAEKTDLKRVALGSA